MVGGRINIMDVLFVTRGCPDKRNNMNGIFEWDQAKAVHENGWHVTYFAIDLRSMRRKRKLGVNHYIRDGIDVYEYNFPLGRVPQSLLYHVGLHGMRRLYSIAYNTSKPDVLHAHFTLYGAIAGEFAREIGLPIVVTEHSSSMIQDNLSSKALRLGRIAYSAPALVISVGKGLADSIFKNFGVKSTVISNIVDLKAFQSCYRSKNDFYTFITAGNLVDRKNHAMLVDAFSIVHSRIQNTKLIIIGSGPLEKRIKRQIREMELSCCVEMTGRLSRNDIASKFAKSDCFVLASKYETFGVVLIEAMASGLPIVSTRCGGPDGFVSKDVGILVENNNVEALAEGMVASIENRQKYNPKEIRKYAMANFAGSVIARKIIDCYKKAMQKLNSEH